MTNRKLTLTPNFGGEGDAFYAELIAAQAGLGGDQLGVKSIAFTPEIWGQSQFPVRHGGLPWARASAACSASASKRCQRAATTASGRIKWTLPGRAP